MTVALPALFLALLIQDLPPDPTRQVREIQRAIDRDGGGALERQWRAALARRPRDPAALHAVATFARARYRYERADSLLLLLAEAPAPAWRTMARLGMAQWRALGSDPARADSLFVEARAIAQGAAFRPGEADAVLGLVQLRQRSRGVKVGEALLDEWWRLLDRPTPDDSANRLCLAGGMQEQLGDTTGIRRIREGALIAERHGAWRVAGSCELMIAQSAERRGYLAGAHYSARKALGHYGRIRYELGTALASQWFGYVKVRGAGFAEGRQLLERAIVAARATRFASVEAWAHSGLAELHLSLGDLTQARRHAAVAAESHAERGDRWGVAVSRRFEAMALEAAGDLTSASSRYAEAHAAFVAAGLPLNGMSALAQRALLQVRLGQLDSAAATMSIADELGRTTEGWRNQGAVVRAIVAMRTGRLTTADSLLRSTLMSRRWRAGERHLAAVTVAAREAQVALRMERPAVAESALTVVTTALNEWRRRPSNEGLQASLAQLRDSWGGISDAIPDIVAQLVARDRLALAFTVVEQVRAREVAERALRAAASLADSVAGERLLVRQREATGALAPGAVAGVERVQRSLAPDEAFVSYTVGLDDVNTTAIVLTREHAVALTLAGREALLADLRRFVQLAAGGTEAAAAGRRLGNALLAPVFAAVPATVTRLLISPDGELHRLPFDALRLPDGRFAIERATITIAPSATALLALRLAPEPSGDRLVAFGDPTYAQRAGSSRRGSDPASADPRGAAFVALRLPRLPHSGDEARRVGRYGVQRSVHLTRAASEEAVMRTDWRDVAVVHFAAHAIVDPDGDAGTALALAPGARHDGFLTPGEMGALALHGALVVLSACRSSGGQVLGGEGLRGLTAPLLEAGARTVVATHWSIGDRSVVPFVDRFYAAMAAGRRVDDALRDAKLAAIRDGVSIADWGSFAIIGDGSLRVPLRRPGLAPVAWLRNASQVRRDTSGT